MVQHIFSNVNKLKLSNVPMEKSTYISLPHTIVRLNTTKHKSSAKNVTSFDLANHRASVGGEKHKR